VTNRDVDFIEDRTLLCEQVMTKELVVANETCTLVEAYSILRNSKKAKLPIVNSKGELVGLLSRT
jgi:IMP dehydrogenase